VEAVERDVRWIGWDPARAADGRGSRAARLPSSAIA